MITPADDFDDGPDLDPDDPLTVILRPTPGHLGPPPGRYEEIRRGAARRRVLRAAAGVGATCAVAALAVLLPLRLTASDAPARPTVPLAPPPMSSSPTMPTPSPSVPSSSMPSPPTPSPSVVPGAERPTQGAATPAPAPVPSTAPDGTAVPETARTPVGEPSPSVQQATPSDPSTPSLSP
ncbi:hypothetical protein [Streptomyces sp. NPDC050121]|uniref:hypothetical protein n=1 Tax=Streptomyces sp. NPDC050121 TaxID=3365601 RepID=UPI0037AE2B7A